MNIHEYQAKQVLKGYGAPVADGVAIFEAAKTRQHAQLARRRRRFSGHTNGAAS